MNRHLFSEEPIELLKTMHRILEGASTNPYQPETELNPVPRRAGGSACPSPALDFFPGPPSRVWYCRKVRN